MVESQVLQSMKLFEKISKLGFIYKLGLPSFFILVNNKNGDDMYLKEIIDLTPYMFLAKFLEGTIESVIDRKIHIYGQMFKMVYTIVEMLKKSLIVFLR